MKVTIINNSSAAITVKGRHTLNIEGQKTNVFNIPDTPQMANTLNRLRREYPALKITVEKDVKPSPATQEASGQNVANDHKNSEPKGPDNVADKKPNEPEKTPGQEQPQAVDPNNADKDAAQKASIKNKAGK